MKPIHLYVVRIYMTRTNIRVVRNLAIVEPFLLSAIEIQTVGAVYRNCLWSVVSYSLVDSEGLGARVSGDGAVMEHAFRIRGMDCADEVAVLKRAVCPIVGGEDRLSFDLLQGKMGVEGFSEVPLAAIQDAVAKTGMRAETWDDRPLDQDGENAWRRHGRTITTAASGGLVASGLVVHAVILGGVTAALTGTEPGFGDGVPPACPRALRPRDPQRNLVRRPTGVVRRQDAEA